MIAESAHDDRKIAQRLVVAARDFAATGNDDAEAEMLDAEGDIIERLAIDPDDTERGLNLRAVARIEKFVSEQVGYRWSYVDGLGTVIR